MGMWMKFWPFPGQEMGICCRPLLIKQPHLWQVGHDQSLGVYPHNNNVTCVEFNPVDDNFLLAVQ
nr:WD repeat-containing protein 44-like [Ipomoea batatas]